MASSDLKPKVGLFTGGIETYWKNTGMEELPARLQQDSLSVMRRLEERFEVVYPGTAGNVAEAVQRAREIRCAEVDVVVIYHATYVDDAMSLAFFDEIGRDIYPIILHSQGMHGIPATFDLIAAGTTWGNNSAVQICGTLKRMRPDFTFGYVFGAIDNPEIYQEIEQYVRAWRAIRRLRRSRVAYLPHRCVACPMYDTFPDDTMMMAQTGVEITYLFTLQLMDEMKEVSESAADALYRKLIDRCEVVEPTKEELRLACRQAIALENLIRKHKIDSLAIDMFPELTPRTGMIPALGMALLIDKGIVVSTEGDLSVAVGGLILQELSGKPIHFWEHLLFDEEKNWILGGHEGGSAGFRMAKKGVRPKLRSTQYVDFRHVKGAPRNGVLPEFITEPGPVTLLNLFRGPSGYEMRIATGESVDTDPRPVHFEHTIFKPDIPLKDYFTRMKAIGVCHHFGLVHANIAKELGKVAEMMRMKCEILC